MQIRMFLDLWLQEGRYEFASGPEPGLRVGCAAGGFASRDACAPAGQDTGNHEESLVGPPGACRMPAEKAQDEQVPFLTSGPSRYSWHRLERLFPRKVSGESA